VESLVATREWVGTKVLITGHTGFKGSWLAEWLLLSGADVAGLALAPDGSSDLFEALSLARRLSSHHEVDIRDSARVAEVVAAVQPQVIFHLAAQSLVRRSYREPLATWQVNVDGTLNVLEAARKLQRPMTIVVVTTDKVYKNREWEFAYREEDELGGHDPYSASKAACEIAVASWRASFGSHEGVRVATARAGNVIGPGDQGEDRIVPDCYRAWRNGQAVQLRNPTSTRPWQHVLEPLSGYLALANHMRSGQSPIDACNFGPGSAGDRSVESLVGALGNLGTGRTWSVSSGPHPHEARTLALAIDRAKLRLGWAPRLDFTETMEWTDQGYSAAPDHLPEVVCAQLGAYIGLITSGS
jgi:CDP-glucose 4,6-dehydratase